MDVIIRSLEGMDDLTRAVEFQEFIWGAGFPERAPPSLMMVAARLGGVVAGAFDSDGTMVGFVFGITGVEDGRPVHWSDMLGVSPGGRDRGLGTRLKRFQRERLLEEGVTRMYWSQDPLESRNAWLNLRRLGAVAREYVVDMYGESSSPLHRGLGTDRFVIRWDLDSDRVRRRLDEDRDADPSPGALPVLLSWRDEGGALRPAGPDGAAWTGDGPRLNGDTSPDGFLVAIPARIQQLKSRSPGAATEWRRATRAVLRPALEAGWTVTDLVRAGPVSQYVVRPPAAGAP